MRKLAVFFNTYTKLQSYELDEINRKLDLDYVFVVSINELALTQNRFAHENIKILIAKILLRNI